MSINQNHGVDTLPSWERIALLKDKIARLEAECLKLRECPDCGGDKTIAEIARRMGHRPDIAFREVARLEAECAALRAAFESACDFIDSHVADPDITNEMWTNYAIFSERRKLIAAMQAGEKCDG